MSNTHQLCKESQNPQLNRRGLLKHLLVGAVVSSLPAIGGCQHFTPRPFQVGQIKPAPLGCKELRARDPRGDC